MPRLLQALVDPPAAMRRAAGDPRPLGTAAALAAAALAMGLATVPRQLAILHGVLAPTGDPAGDMHRAALRAGLVRLIVADRVVPSPTLLVAGVLLVVLAEPVLMLSRERRPAIAQVVLLGLAPLMVDRLGELVITYLVPFAAQATPGDAVLVPHRFRTGPMLLWRAAAPAPAWLELLEPRANLVVLWTVLLWGLGLRELEGRGRSSWHVTLPLVCVLGAGVVTWILGPLVAAAILRAG